LDKDAFAGGGAWEVGHGRWGFIDICICNAQETLDKGACVGLGAVDCEGVGFGFFGSIFSEGLRRGFWIHRLLLME